ncbi:MAG: transposase [Saprospirales bacterium]|nr:transposase [Saprospirales bacterium]
MAWRGDTPLYTLLLRTAWKTICSLCEEADHVGGMPGMTAVLHTWGSDLKYHVHAHCLVTFGGLTADPVPEWKWPKRKNKLAPFRKFSKVYRTLFLAALQELMSRREVVYHQCDSCGSTDFEIRPIPSDLTYLANVLNQGRSPPFWSSRHGQLCEYIIQRR